MNPVIARELKFPRNDVCINKMYSMHGVIELLQVISLTTVTSLLFSGPARRRASSLHAVYDDTDRIYDKRHAAVL